MNSTPLYNYIDTYNKYRWGFYSCYFRQCVFIPTGNHFVHILSNCFITSETYFQYHFSVHLHRWVQGEISLLLMKNLYSIYTNYITKKDEVLFTNQSGLIHKLSSSFKHTSRLLPVSFRVA